MGISKEEKTINASGSGQLAMFYHEQHQTARANETFLALVNSGTTKSDLARCIEKRPARWKRYEHWLDQLPEIRPDKKQNAHERFTLSCLFS